MGAPDGDGKRVLSGQWVSPGRGSASPGGTPSGCLGLPFPSSIWPLNTGATSRHSSWPRAGSWGPRDIGCASGSGRRPEPQEQEQGPAPPTPAPSSYRRPGPGPAILGAGGPGRGGGLSRVRRVPGSQIPGPCSHPPVRASRPGSESGPLARLGPCPSSDPPSPPPHSRLERWAGQALT